MEHGFPPGSTVEDVRAVWLLHHAIMLGLLLVAAGGHLLTKQRLTQPETLWLCSIVLTLTPAAAVWTWAGLSSQWVNLGGSAMQLQTFAVYVLLYWIVGFSGSIRTIRGTNKISAHTRLASFHAYGNILCPIIGVVVASILIPVMSVRGEAAYRSACRSNLRSIGRALESHLKSTKTYPQATIGSPPMT